MKTYKQYIINEGVDLKTPFNIQLDIEEKTEEFFQEMVKKYEDMFLNKRVKLKNYYKGGDYLEIKVCKLEIINGIHITIKIRDEKGNSYYPSEIMSVKETKRKFTEEDPYGEEDWTNE